MSLCNIGSGCRPQGAPDVAKLPCRFQPAGTSAMSLRGGPWKVTLSLVTGVCHLKSKGFCLFPYTPTGQPPPSPIVVGTGQLLPYVAAIALPLAALTLSPGRLMVGEAVQPNCVGTAGVPSSVTMSAMLAGVTVPCALA